MAEKHEHNYRVVDSYYRGSFIVFIYRCTECPSQYESEE